MSINLGRSGSHSLEIISARRSDFGNLIVSGKTIADGRGLLVFSPTGHVRGNISDDNGAMTISTSRDGARYLSRDKVDGITKSRKQDVIDRKEYLGVDLSPVFHATKVAEPPSPSLATRQAHASEVTRYPRFRHGKSQLGVLVYYDIGVEQPFNYIDYAIELANLALEASGPNYHLI